MTSDLRTAAFLFVGLVGWMLMVPHCTGRARAQSDEDVRIVAITTAHESTSIADARGIWSVLRSIADRHGWSLRTPGRSYSPRMWRGETRRPWVLNLDEGCRHRVGPIGPVTCTRLFAHVREVMHGERCPVTLWGSRIDWERWRGPPVVFVECADGERNRFATTVSP